MKRLHLCWCHFAKHVNVLHLCLLLVGSVIFARGTDFKTDKVDCKLSVDGASECNNSKKYPEVASAGPENEGQETCPEKFFLNPSDTERNTFLLQFKPCGWYAEHCGKQKFRQWFGDQYNDNAIEANVCYPDFGKRDLDEGVQLVQFDTGLDRSTYEAYLNLEDEAKFEYLLDDLDVYGDQDNMSGRFLDFTNTGDWTSPKIKFGESCIETFVKTNDDWGKIGGLKNVYGCMGNCGTGCQSLGRGRDCLKHDVCSFFKSYALQQDAKGFCKDIDCGDEAAQTVINCWVRNQKKFLPDYRVSCDRYMDEQDSNFYAKINPAARLLFRQKMACTLRTKWERNQGMPNLRNPDGTFCNSPDDCTSRRCDLYSYFSPSYSICIPRLKNGERCNEHNDCISLSCGNVSFNPFNWRCLPSLI